MIAPLLLLIPLTLILGGAKWQSVHHTTHKLLHCFSFDSRSIWSLVKLCNKRDTVLRVLCAQSLSLQNIQCVTDGWPEAAFYSGPIWSSIHRQTASAIFSSQPCWRMIPILYLGKYGPQLHQTFNHIFDSLSHFAVNPFPSLTYFIFGNHVSIGVHVCSLSKNMLAGKLSYDSR